MSKQNQREMTFKMHIDGKEVECTVLFTFYSKVTDAHYMLYTTDKPSAGGQLNMSAARYDPKKLSALYPLNGEEDRKIVQDFINYVSSHTPEEIKRDFESAQKQNSAAEQPGTVS